MPEARQIDAVGAQKRIARSRRGAEASGVAGAVRRVVGQRSARERALEIREVVERARIILHRLVTVEIGRVGYDFDVARRPVDLQGRQGEAILVAHQFGRGGHVTSLARIGEAHPVLVVIVDVLLFVEHAGCDQQRRIDLPCQGGAGGEGSAVIAVLVDRVARQIIDAVDITAVAPVPGADAETEHVVDERSAERGAGFIGRRAVLRGRELGFCVSAVIGEARLRRDITHRAAFGARAEERALRSAQNFHALQIEHRRKRVVGAEAQRADLDRRVVDIDAGGRVAGAGIDAADGDVVRRFVEGHARRVFHEVGEILDVQLVHALAGEGADALRHLAQRFFAAFGRDDHFFDDAAGSAGALRLGRQCAHRQRKRNGCDRKIERGKNLLHGSSPRTPPWWGFMTKPSRMAASQSVATAGIHCVISASPGQ